MQIQFKSSKIYYTSQGSGYPLVLLHGFLESSNIWKDISVTASQRRQIICIDLPGHGRTETIADIHSMELMAEAVKAVLTELQVSKADFLGHSMGGYVCLAFLEQYPEAVRKLALLNSTPEADTAERKENRDRAVAVVQKNKSAFVSMAISNLLTPESSKRHQKELEEMKEEAKEFPTNGIIANLQGMKIRTDRKALLRNFPGEKFLIIGSEDPILEANQLKKIAEATKTRLLLFSGGHLGYMENKQDFEEFVHFIE